MWYEGEGDKMTRIGTRPVTVSMPNTGAKKKIIDAFLSRYAVIGDICMHRVF
jgi:hypothetical protein